MTTVEWPSEKNKPTATGTLVLLHELSGHIVDGREVIGVHGVPQAETVGQEAQGSAPRGRHETEPSASVQAATFKAARKT